MNQQRLIRLEKQKQRLRELNNTIARRQAQQAAWQRMRLAELFVAELTAQERKALIAALPRPLGQAETGNERFMAALAAMPDHYRDSIIEALKRVTERLQY